MMQMYFWIVGIGSLIYYILIRRYTGRWNSTFAGFWLLCGGGHLLGALCWDFLPGGFRMSIQIVLILVWILFAGIELLIFKGAKSKPKADAEYLIVLGAQVRGTKITNSLMRRLDEAYTYLLRNPRAKVIVSGGQGDGEDISEAEAMAENLRLRGIKPDRIILEDQSTSTEENLKFSALYIPSMESSSVVLVTNNFHIYRALMLGRQAGYRNLSGLPATSNPVLLLNYLVREFFAVLLTKARAML